MWSLRTFSILVYESDALVRLLVGDEHLRARAFRARRRGIDLGEARPASTIFLDSRHWISVVLFGELLQLAEFEQVRVGLALRGSCTAGIFRP